MRKNLQEAKWENYSDISGKKINQNLTTLDINLPYSSYIGDGPIFTIQMNEEEATDLFRYILRKYPKSGYAKLWKMRKNELIRK